MKKEAQEEITLSKHSFWALFFFFSSFLSALHLHLHYSFNPLQTLRNRNHYAVYVGEETEAPRACVPC